VICSFPCVCAGGEAVVVSGLSVTQTAQRKISISQAELAAEREEAFSFLGIPTGPTQ
jgi:hypothetical protein